MTIIVGLGNPGEKFNLTRHNVGFMVLDFFAAKNGFDDFLFSKKYTAEISENNGVILVKPQTFMNDSGRAAQALLKNKEATLIVVHDDIDLPLGNIKFSVGSSSGGHKGVQSIIDMLGTKDFIRLKIGIATNDQKAMDVVLKKFSKEEQKMLDEVIEKSAEALDYFLENGIEKTMNKYN